jgi:two-component system, LytTR family, sensor kinase
MRTKLLIHFGIIFCYVAYHIIFNYIYDPSAEVPYADRILYFLSCIAVSYAFYLIILPRYFKPRKYVSLAVSVLLLFGMYCLFQYGLDYMYKETLAPDDPLQPFNLTFFFNIHLYYFFQSFIFGFAFWLHKDALARERKSRELEKQKELLKAESLRAELSLLKAQINPHLLFNILNFFYAKSYHVSEELGEAIHRLATLLRYTMREHADNRVPLTEEVENIENYIAIQQMLFSNELHVDLRVEGDINQKDILPLVLITHYSQLRIATVLHPQQKRQIKARIIRRHWPDECPAKAGTGLCRYVHP